MKKVALLLLLMVCRPGLAADDVQWGVGAVAISRADEYRNASAEALVVPAVFLRAGRFSVNGLSMRYDLVQSGAFTAGPWVEGRFDGYDPSDSPYLTGMAPRHPAAYGGAFARTRTKLGVLRLKALGDITNVHGGGLVNLRYDYPIPLARKLRLSPYVSGEYRSQAMVDYYYGVRPDEALPGRPAYTAPAGWVREGGVILRIGLDQRQGLFIATGYTRLGSAMADSPLIGGQDSYVHWVLGYTLDF